MKLAILNYTNGNLSGGYRKYLNEVIPRINSNSTISSMKVFIHENVAREYDDYNIVPFKNKAKLINNIEQFNPDILFCPTTDCLKNWRFPFVVMLRNMEPMKNKDLKNPFVENWINLYKKIKTVSSCRKANGVIAVSKYVKETLENDILLNKEKLKLIYHGTEVTSLVKNTNISNDLFTSGSIRPARGLEDLIYALSIVRNNYKNIKLYIAGAVSPRMNNYMDKLIKLTKSLNVYNNIYWLGHLSKEEMNLFYSKSKIFVMTSRVEACPNIALEAMSIGNIIISTTNDPMPEFFRDGALYYNAEDYEQLANLIIHSMAFNNEIIKKTKNKNRIQLEKYSWDICANKTVKFLYKIYNKNSKT